MIRVRLHTKVTLEILQIFCLTPGYFTGKTELSSSVSKMRLQILCLSQFCFSTGSMYSSFLNICTCEHIHLHHLVIPRSNRPYMSSPWSTILQGVNQDLAPYTLNHQKSHFSELTCIKPSLRYIHQYFFFTEVTVLAQVKGVETGDETGEGEGNEEKRKSEDDKTWTRGEIDIKLGWQAVERR